ncbi:MAG: DUF5622 domain-containing protein [Thermoprotei archaeon]
MGLKHGKYVYVKRSDGWYVKVRVLNIRFKKTGKPGYEFDINDPTKYIVLPVKTREPPIKARIVNAEDLPEEVRKLVYEI